MAASNLPAVPQSRTAQVRERALSAARTAIRRVRERSDHLMNAAIGTGAGVIAARVTGGWRGRRARDAGNGTIVADLANALELGSTTIENPATIGGLGVALAGALGVTGDDRIDAGLFAAGLATVAADQAIDAYQTALVEPP